MITLKAKEIATAYHRGQYRKSLPGQEPLPYIIHPAKVVYYLQKYGVDDERAQAIGWLHDTLEDTPLQYEDLVQQFGKYVADSVFILTRNTDNSSYKERIAKADYRVKMVKLADVLHNVKTLQLLTPRGLEQKIRDCEEFYVPLAEQICPALAEDLRRYLMQYNQKYGRDN